MTVIGERPATRFVAGDVAFADAPPELRGLSRDRVRLLAAEPRGVVHARFMALADHLTPGDVVVVNDSATDARQLDGFLDRSDGVGHAVVLHLATLLDDGTWVIELRSSPEARRAVLDARTGDVVRVGDVSLTLLEPHPFRSAPTVAGNRLWRAVVEGPLDEELDRHGRPIAYGYLRRRFPLSAYQTIFATQPGSAEMASAARPFTPAVVGRLRSRDVEMASVTLHTGVSSQEAGEGPQAERFAVPAATAQLVNQARERGGRVVAVGTTVTRALESAVNGAGRVSAAAGWTDRVVTPSDPPRVVTGLVTGWHDAGASHLLLVEAVAGTGLTQVAYDAALDGGYRWHEFGDSALLLPDLSAV